MKYILYKKLLPVLLVGTLFSGIALPDTGQMSKQQSAVVSSSHHTLLARSNCDVVGVNKARVARHKAWCISLARRAKIGKVCAWLGVAGIVGVCGYKYLWPSAVVAAISPQDVLGLQRDVKMLKLKLHEQQEVERGAALTVVDKVSDWSNNFVMQTAFSFAGSKLLGTVLQVFQPKLSTMKGFIVQHTFYNQLMKELKPENIVSTWESDKLNVISSNSAALVQEIEKILGYVAYCLSEKNVHKRYERLLVSLQSKERVLDRYVQELVQALEKNNEAEELMALRNIESTVDSLIAITSILYS